MGNLIVILDVMVINVNDQPFLVSVTPWWRGSGVA